MPMKRIEFSLPYKVKKGASVMNMLGHEVGTIVEVADEPHEASDGYRFNVTADVKADTDADSVQVMEPTLPL